MLSKIQPQFIRAIQASFMEPTVSHTLNHIIAKTATKIVNNIVFFQIPFAGRNRFKALEIRRGYLRGKIAIRGNRNHIGIMYAGALFTLSELPGGIISKVSFEPSWFPILKHCEMEFIKPSTTDVTIEIDIPENELERIEKVTAEKGKCDFKIVGKLYNKHHELVARYHGDYQLRQPKS